MDLSPARRLAFEVVKRVREKGSFASEALQSAVARSNLSPRDKAFATRLAYGTIAARGTLDELVAAELKRPEITPLAIKDSLAISAYELFFEGTEPYVVVHQGVELVGFAMRSRIYTGMSNAVLRRLAEKRDSLFPDDDSLVELPVIARVYGHPLWLAELLRDEYGIEVASAVMKTNNEPAPLYVAHLPFLESEKQSLALLDKAGISWQSADVTGAFLIEDRAAFWGLPHEQRQSFVAMDLAAQQVVQLVDVQPDQRILEIGSGRGTKSLALAASARRLGGPASVAGVDLFDFKVKVAQDTARRYGVREAQYYTADIRKKSAKSELEVQFAASRMGSSFDTVLVDAPCSGLGTLRRAVDKRWKLKADDIKQLAELGLQMLKWSAGFVAPGGTLVFATCTIASEENQAVVEAFLGSPEGESFEIVPLESSELAPCFERYLSEEGFLNALPQSEGPDGHFVARLTRSD